MKTIFASEVTKKLGALISDVASSGTWWGCPEVCKGTSQCAKCSAQKWVHPLPKNFMPCWKYFAVGSQNFLHQHCSSTMFKILDVSNRTIFSAQWFGDVVAVERTIHAIFFSDISSKSLVWLLQEIYMSSGTHFFDQSEASKFVLLVIQNSEGICTSEQQSWIRQQESIPVGCVLPAHYRVRGSLWQRPPGQRPPSPCEQNDWHTHVKILPCPKLRLRLVTIGIVPDSPWPCSHSDPPWLDFSICGLKLLMVLI